MIVRLDDMHLIVYQAIADVVCLTVGRLTLSLDLPEFILVMVTYMVPGHKAT